MGPVDESGCCGTLSTIRLGFRRWKHGRVLWVPRLLLSWSPDSTSYLIGKPAFVTRIPQPREQSKTGVGPLGSSPKLQIQNPNRTAFCFTLLLLALSNAQLVGQEALESQSEPRRVYVAQPQAEIRSGPSEDYYPTSFAKAGEALDVYTQTQDGWLGIRPPEGSFSWVPAKDAYLLPGGKTIEITSEQSVSWIGTSMGSAKQFRWQVELEPGEQLNVIGERTNVDREGNRSLWYRVLPPSGEFRWIHESAVSRERLEAIIDLEKLEAARTTGPTLSKTFAENPVVSAQYQPPAPALPQHIDAANPGYGPLDSVQMLQNGVPTEAPHIHDDAIVYDDSVVYDDPAHIHTEVAETPYITPGTSSSAPAFTGWHAFDLTDDGLRFTLLERIAGRNRAAVDPYKSDPFSLAMPARQKQAQVVPTAADPYVDRPYARRERPWRDPRTLGAMRQRNHTSAADSRADSAHEEYYAGRDRQGGMLSEIRERVNNLGDSVARLRGSTGTQESDIRTDEFEFDDSDFAVQQGTESRDNDLEFYSREGESAGPDAIDWYGVKDRPSSSLATENTSPPTAPRELTAMGPSTTPGASNFVSRELDDLQVTLGEMVSGPPSTWNLDSLQRRTEYLIEHGTTPVERGRARLLLERIEEFKQHEQRSAFLPSGVSRASYQAPPRNPTTTQSRQPAAQTAAQTAGYQRPVHPTGNLQSFDATGWLAPVYGKLQGERYYALQDASGAIVAYVSTLPGMNLDVYLHQAVGIRGLKGYLPQLQAGHIQAESIVRL